MTAVQLKNKNQIRRNIHPAYWIFLFIDCDTIINEELKDIDNLSCEIAAVQIVHLSIKYSWMKTNIKKWSSVLGWKYSENDFYFNSGVLFC